ncbi:carboxypeptidase B-like [Tetranychus urticae]|uniref:carboxypeptidase B-like n=1 Tax=Tetranychus urticae TaxID=32264 RepID=UPI00077C0672|nr:carboxypeptidase B-like [Tetranychus urticae]
MSKQPFFLISFIVTIINCSNFVSTLSSDSLSRSISVPRNYSGHTVVKLLSNEVPKLFPFFNGSTLSHQQGSKNSDNELEELWTVNEMNSTFSVLRLGPAHRHRLKRSTGYSIISDDLQEWINRGFGPNIRSARSTKRIESVLVRDFRLDKYQPLDEIYRYLDELVNVAPVRVFDIGETHEGRKIKAIEIRGNSQDPRLVWIDATIHAREWISPATIIYIIEQALVTKAKVNFLMVPVFNPDGYEYSWTVDRLWRKNRRLSSSTSPLSPSSLPNLPRSADAMTEECNGVDLNRNFDASFDGQGSSDDVCSQLYQGPSPFSEPETRSVGHLIWTMRKNIKLAISIHSFSQLWACPYAYDTAPTPHYREHMEVLKAIQDAVYKTHGVQYTIGPLSTSLYVGSGFSMDWMYERAGIAHSYLVELRDKGVYGFLLPADQIIPTATETWAGIKAAIYKVLDVKIRS